MDPLTQNTSLQRLQNVEKVGLTFYTLNFLFLVLCMVFNCTTRFLTANFCVPFLQRIVRVLELAGGVMEELANPAGPRKEFVNNHCSEFMQFIKVSLLCLTVVLHVKCCFKFS